MTTDLMIIDEESIKNKIYYIRGTKVMLDSDLAIIYGYTTRAFNQQVKNNIERFDDDLRFRLTKEELEILSRSKNLILNKSKNKRGSNIKYLPYVFTEEGIYMLMTILKGEKAVKQSKALIKIFKSMKDYLVNNKILEQEYINNMVFSHDKELKEIKTVMEKYEKKR